MILVVCLLLTILLPEKSLEIAIWGESRLLGGGGLGDNMESYDCPCSCSITSIQGSSATQFIAVDTRCDMDAVPNADIGGHPIDCPCGCKLVLNTNTSVIIPANHKCATTDISKIDELNLVCPCSCKGMTGRLTSYELPRTSRCKFDVDIPFREEMDGPGVQMKEHGVQMKDPGEQMKDPGEQMKDPGEQIKEPAEQMETPSAVIMNNPNELEIQELQKQTITLKPDMDASVSNIFVPKVEAANTNMVTI